MKNAIVNGRKREANTIEHNWDNNKEQVDFVRKPNQHLIIESRSNLTVGLFILWMDYWINKRNHFSINEFITLLATGTLDLVWL